MSLIEASNQAPALSAATKDERRTDRPVSGRVKRALDLMVYGGKRFEQAAIEVGLTPRAMRMALERANCLKYLREQKQVFRASISAQNVHSLADIRDNSSNPIARVSAIKVLEQLDIADGGGTKQQPPGFALVIVQSGASPVLPTIIEHDDK
jgi:hypothetical protein